jgi:DNA-binding HxlR family transcriptional regulator
VRDLMRGKHRFGEFLASAEGIPTNILANRLQRLTDAGLVAARPYHDHPPRLEYSLTARGEDLRPVIRAMVDWGVRHAGGRLPPPVKSEVTSSTLQVQSATTRPRRQRRSVK